MIFLKRYLVFTLLLLSSVSSHCSFRKAFLTRPVILWNSAFSWVYRSLSPLPLLLFFPQLFVKPTQTITLPSCISFLEGWFWLLPPVQCYEPPSIVLQTVCLPDLIPWIPSSLLLYNHKGFDLGYILMTWWFSLLFQLKPELCNKELMIWATVDFRSCFLLTP